MSIKIFKLIFSFTFELNEKKSVVEKYGLERGVTRKFLLAERFDVYYWKGGGVFQKRGIDKKKVKKVGF